MPLAVSSRVCRDRERALQLEWLDSNGIGGYASSTILNCHTRKYHGLLVSQLAGLSDRHVLLSNLDDWIAFSDTKKELRLTVHRYRGTFHPNTAPPLSGYKQEAMPSFTYTSGKSRFKKQIMLLYGRDAVLIKYKAEMLLEPSTLFIRALLAYRNFHSLSRENLYLRPRTFPCKNGFSIAPYGGMPPCFFQLSGEFRFFPSPDWYRNFEYVMEQERGFDSLEDLFSPGVLEIPLASGAEVIVSVSTCEITEPLQELWAREVSRRKKLEAKLNGTAFEKALAKAASHSLIEKAPGRRSVVAGYHWFLEWGRDTMVSLPGMLSGGVISPDECAGILKLFASCEKNGLIPNFISADGNAYNSVDASLWFVWALQQYAAYTNDYGGIRCDLWQTVKKIITSYKIGTDFGIKMLENGLITAGDKNTQLTWMDASVNRSPITPRHGCPVEVNALWYNALRFASELAGRLGDQDAAFEGVMRSIPIANLPKLFIDTFWIEEKGCLGDVWTGGRLDMSIRPNQIFAVSLPYSMVPVDKARRLLKVVENELLTPYGLRTLSPRDPGYRGRYRGGPAERDAAYHNGTVWPWLLGHFCEALMKTSGDENKTRTRIKKILSNFPAHLNEAGLGFVSEVFDGDPPHAAGGCIAQAWSAAELLRASKMIERETLLDAVGTGKYHGVYEINSK